MKLWSESLGFFSAALRCSFSYFCIRNLTWSGGCKAQLAGTASMQESRDNSGALQSDAPGTLQRSAADLGVPALQMHTYVLGRVLLSAPGLLQHTKTIP